MVLDILIFILSLGILGASLLWSAAGRNGELRAEVEASGETYLLPLSRDGELVVEGPVGTTRIAVEGGTVRVVDSDCKDKICVAMGRISEPSGWVACLPNRVFVSLRALAAGENDEEAIDAGSF